MITADILEEYGLKTMITIQDDDKPYVIKMVEKRKRTTQKKMGWSDFQGKTTKKLWLHPHIQ